MVALNIEPRPRRGRPPSDPHRIEKIAELAEQGKNCTEIARALGLNQGYVWNIAASNGIEMVKAPRGARPESIEKAKARAQRMVSLYKAGATLAQIGHLYGLTRERVRQLMTKYYGITAKDGGYTIIAKRQAEERTALNDARSHLKRGCSVADYRQLRNLSSMLLRAGVPWTQTPNGAFQEQRRNYRSIGVPFELKLWEWWQVWQRSGKWAERGRGRGRYGMLRHDTSKGYVTGNVYIGLIGTNHKRKRGNGKDEQQPSD